MIPKMKMKRELFTIRIIKVYKSDPCGRYFSKKRGDYCGR